jgi:single-stranded-DNA-specific exonuclease
MDDDRHLGMAEPARVFADAVKAFGPGPALVLAHNDADGLAAAAIFSKAFGRAGRPATLRVLKRGESPWSREMREELASMKAGGLIVADLGVRREPVLEGTPTIFVDHHVPQGWPVAAKVLTGYGMDPAPTSSLLAFRSVFGIADVDELLWLAALGVVGDMAEGLGFPEMAEARRRYGITALRKAASLVNQPRRAPAGDPAPALALLLKADGPKAVLSGEYPETSELEEAREVVKAELDVARRVAPNVAGDIALIRFASPAQVHPLVAQTWAKRLKGRIVLAANTGFREGWVHFAARSAENVDLVAFLAERAPAGADENYGSGHRNATGGALRSDDWNEFVRGLGFGAEMEVGA